MSFSKKRFWSAMNLGGLTSREAAIRTWAKIGEHEVLTRAAAIAFYAIAAMVPFLALVITLTAWFLPLATWVLPLGEGGSGPSADNPLSPLRDLLPADAASVLGRELARLQESPPTGVVSFGLVALVWLSSSLFVSIMDAMNRTMGVQETRPWWKVRVIAILLTLSQAAILIVAFASTLAWPQILKWLGLSQPAAVIATLIHTVTVFALILISFSVANYFGPDADQRWEWITPGSLLGTLVILCISIFFRIYVQNWGNYSATYGSLAGVVVLMSWIWISSVVLLAAAELNKVIEDASPLGKPYGQRHENRP
jgi:membrane protein